VSVRDDVVLGELTRTSCQLLANEIYFGHLMVRIARIVTRDVPTMAVGMHHGRMTLFINPDFWSEDLTNPAHRIGVLKHELLHVALRHVERSAEIPHKELYNVAADLVVNEIVGRENLPAGALLLDEMDPALGLVAGASAEEHYAKLRKAASEMPQLMQQCQRGDPGTRGSHERWGVAGAGDRSALGELLATAGRETIAARGTIPAAVTREADLARRRRSRVHWKSVLRTFGCSGITTYLKPTIMSPSRRFGVVPGVRVRQRQALAVAIDTSGSIDGSTIESFFAEVHRLWRLGVEVTVIECDADIPEGGVWQYRGRVLRQPQGGGSTDFDAPIRWANTHPVDGLVYLTDGHGGRSLPSRRRLLWMVTTPPSDFGPGSQFWQRRETVCHLPVEAA
jgi:predicted metal-dependent peptidase